MLDLKQLAIDPKKATEGTWVSLLGAKFKIARFNNPQAEAARSTEMLEVYERMAELGEGETPPKELQDKANNANAKVMAEHILLDWKGVGEGDKEIPYTVEYGFKLLSDPAYADLYQAIMRASIQHSNFAAKAEEKVKKQVKSSASS